jgi:hypothetical protein
MKVSQFASQIIESRPYKYQTRQTLYKDLKRLGIWNLDVEDVNSALIRDSDLFLLIASRALWIYARYLLC